jgi:hypothetical protein
VVVTAVAAAALGFGSTALAAYNPGLIVSGTSQTTGSAGRVVIGMGQGANDDATAIATVYSPVGYGVRLTQTPGTRIGNLTGVVRVASQGGAQFDVEGTVTADTPANHVSNTCAPGLHEAVWILQFSLAGNTVRVPIYVDRVTTGPEAAYASARVRVCLPSPYVPPPQGAPAGVSLVIAAFDVRGVFTNPSRRGAYPWNGHFVPYTPGSALPNTANAAQSTSFVRLPTQLVVNARRQRRGGRTFAVVTACLREAGAGIRGVRVNILGGRTVGRARRVAFGRTNARGCVTRRIRVRIRAMVFLATVTEVPERQAAGCLPTTIGPRCSQASIAPVFGLVSRTAVRIRR